MKPGRFAPACLLLLLSILTFSHFPLLPFPPKVAAATLSSVYVNPVQNCCVYSTNSTPVFSVNVMTNLTNTDTISGFDVRLNYTNFYSPNPKHGVVKAISLDYTNSYFSNNFASSQITTQASCIDDITYGQDGFCASDDVSGGQVHFAQTLLGANVTGPVSNALLFSVTFTVNDTGTSLLYLERAHLADPGGVPPNPHFVPVTTSAAVFGNGLVAFFDYHPARSPAVLAGDDTTFDASASFRSKGSVKSSLSSPTYVWSFGDGTSSLSTGSPILQHKFLSPGNYTVSLNVTDANPGIGSFQRVVQVVPPLGSLEVQVKTQNGGIIVEIVTVKLYNLTNPVPPLCGGCTKTISAGGLVNFVGLSPGSYSMNLTGVGVVPSSKVTTVGLGWPTQETVYLTEIVPPPPNFFPLLIFALVIGVGLSVGALALFRRSRMKRLAGPGGSARKPRRP
jgi:hypothetical protein